MFLAKCTNWSSHNSRMCSAVDGGHRSNDSVTPLSILACFIASLIAKNTDAAKNKGGSATL